MGWTVAGKNWRMQKHAGRDISGSVNDLWASQLAYYYESISVGDGTTPPTVTDTDLSGTNKTRRSLLESDSSITQQGDDLVMSVVIPTSQGNWIWTELGLWIYNGTNRVLVYRDLYETPGPSKTASHARNAVISVPYDY